MKLQHLQASSQDIFVLPFAILHLIPHAAGFSLFGRKCLLNPDTFKGGHAISLLIVIASWHPRVGKVWPSWLSSDATCFFFPRKDWLMSLRTFCFRYRTRKVHCVVIPDINRILQRVGVLVDLFWKKWVDILQDILLRMTEVFVKFPVSESLDRGFTRASRSPLEPPNRPMLRPSVLGTATHQKRASVSSNQGIVIFQCHIADRTLSLTFLGGWPKGWNGNLQRFSLDKPHQVPNSSRDLVSSPRHEEFRFPVTQSIPLSNCYLHGLCCCHCVSGSRTVSPSPSKSFSPAPLPWRVTCE